MKGFVFQQQVESRLEIDGEEFRQGGNVTCSLSLKNRSSVALPLSEVSLELALGSMKKIKQKAPDAFELVQAAEFSREESIPPGAEHVIRSTFRLDKNCEISDNTQSLCIVYGLATATPRAHLQLPVHPHADIDGILGVFETSFQFDLRGQKSKNGWVVAKLKVPSGPRFKSAEELDLSFRFTEDKLQLRYAFTVKKLEAGPDTLAIQKKKQNFEQDLERSQYYSPAGFVDAKLLEPIIESALAPITSRFGG
ncbi:MAG: hypothetical protein U0136_12900 [Bdellovibrionota bacterium]